jgi:type I restriction enzyme R subunit
MDLPHKGPLPLEEVVENIYQNINRSYHVGVLVKRLRRVDRDMSGKAREEFSKFIADGDIGRLADNLLRLIQEDFGGTMKLLRNKETQHLLVNYERFKRSFWVAYEAQDEVSSQRRDVFEKSGKLEDYLEEFSRFVKENHDKILALQILLDRPQQWRAQVLEELQTKLKENDFDERELRSAHFRVYQKALADIISMVKHAAKVEEPILTAEERVTLALERVIQDRNFSYEQQQWLGLIREHLVQNLAIEERDFDIFPIFERQGGLGKARILFGGQLQSLIQELNWRIAA